MRFDFIIIHTCILYASLAGEYLGLTGEKFSGVEMLACGLATHYSLPEVSFG